jgi:uncharacterized membrane protein
VTSLSKALRIGFFAALGLAYIVLGHYTSTAEHPALAGVVVGLIPMSALALGIAWQARRRALAVSVCIAALLLIALNLNFLRDHASWLYLTQHAGMMLMMGLSFGLTLSGSHRDALCSRIALMVHGTLDDDYLRYTWQVTLAWTLFFGSSLLISFALFFGTSTATWSTFANLLTPIFVGVMFVAEYVIRLRVLPGRQHINVAGIITAYRRYSQSSHES